ncbi:hypothetical protein T05_13699 [Trichinella murrelli]|uniref:Uncharacterized protein n=1 Tax=Trichinella murrelli TaxID=144512 RepID=A0A0V0U3A3_9BILA|nr:hypothetical protein T05_13699 [Trichinella murrelli]
MGINFIEGCRQADCLLVLHFESVALCFNECMKFDDDSFLIIFTENVVFVVSLRVSCAFMGLLLSFFSPYAWFASRAMTKVAKMSMLIIMEKMLIAVVMKGCFDELMFCCTVGVLFPWSIHENLEYYRQWPLVVIVL